MDVINYGHFRAEPSGTQTSSLNVDSDGRGTDIWAEQTQKASGKNRPCETNMKPNPILGQFSPPKGGREPERQGN